MRKLPVDPKPYFTEILVRVQYSASDAKQARAKASEMSAQLREVPLAGKISTKVSSVKHIRRNLAEEQQREQHNVIEF